MVHDLQGTFLSWLESMISKGWLGFCLLFVGSTTKYRIRNSIDRSIGLRDTTLHKSRVNLVIYKFLKDGDAKCDGQSERSLFVHFWAHYQFTRFYLRFRYKVKMFERFRTNAKAIKCHFKRRRKSYWTCSLPKRHWCIERLFYKITDRWSGICSNSFSVGAANCWRHLSTVVRILFLFNCSKSLMNFYDVTFFFLEVLNWNENKGIWEEGKLIYCFCSLAMHMYTYRCYTRVVHMSVRIVEHSLTCNNPLPITYICRS